MYDFNINTNTRIKKAYEMQRIPTLEECLNDKNYNLLMGIYKKMEQGKEYFTEQELELIHIFFDIEE